MDEPVLEQEWVNKPKGMLQVLYVRRWIDPTKTKSTYLVNNKDDKLGLRLMVARMPDFGSKQTHLQHMGIGVDRSPKHHPEIAREGVEYSWGCSKGKYLFFPLIKKTGATKLQESYTSVFGFKGKFNGRALKVCKVAEAIHFSLSSAAFN